MGFEANAKAHVSAGNLQVAGDGAPKASPTLCPPMPADADLAALARAWPTLPEPIKAGILALVKAAGGGD